MNSLPIFIGYDPRQPVAGTVLNHSILSRASRPISLNPLVLKQLPLKRRGLTEFTYSRWLVPWLCNFEGYALFMDPDMLVLGDVWETMQHVDGNHAAYVVKNTQQFEWPSFMLFDCAKCTKLTPEFVEDTANKLFDFRWMGGNGNCGSLPAEWNHCVGYDKPTDNVKLAHYTQGIPAFKELRELEPELVRAWNDEYARAIDTVSWLELMGPSVHAHAVIQRLQQKQQQAA